MVRVLNVLVVGILLAAVSGCETMPWKKDTMPPVELLDETKAASGGQDTMTGPAEKPAALQMSTSQRIKDIPLPAKAKEDLDRTYVYESSTLQPGTHGVYHTRVGE